VSVPRALARYARAARSADAPERCALCAEPLPEAHRHLVDRREGGVACACRACALLFDRADADLPYRTVPERVLVDPGLVLRVEEWAETGLPVHLAFVVRVGEGWRAWMPGPAGATEAEPSSEALSALAERTPLVARLEPERACTVLARLRGDAGATLGPGRLYDLAQSSLKSMTSQRDVSS